MRVLLLGATLIDGTGGAPTPDAAVAVEGERIVAVGRRGDFGKPALGDRVVDLAEAVIDPRVQEPGGEQRPRPGPGL